MRELRIRTNKTESNGFHKMYGTGIDFVLMHRILANNSIKTISRSSFHRYVALEIM